MYYSTTKKLDSKNKKKQKKLCRGPSLALGKGDLCRGPGQWPSAKKIKKKIFVWALGKGPDPKWAKGHPTTPVRAPSFWPTPAPPPFPNLTSPLSASPSSLHFSLPFLDALHCSINI